MPRPVMLCLVLLFALLVGACGGSTVGTRTAAPPSTATTGLAGFRGGTVALSALPPEARTTLRRIDQGGPYPYSQDDSVFSNREGILPSRPSGTYHEYTVVTPGSSDRGARRIVVGRAGERYYTDDHYDSFRFVVDQ
ncbi:MAG: ribonuclease N [Chloroflexi bacterium]|nr:ribonuclease N [Chloroflexota bacterium]